MSQVHDVITLYHDGEYRKAYALLCEIMNTPHSGWSKVGDLYVFWAGLEIIVNDDVRRAKELLDRALRLGCECMSEYYRSHGFVLWRTGDRRGGVGELEKSVAIAPSISSLLTLGKVLSRDGDGRASQVLEKVLEKDPKNCMARIALGVLAAKTGDKDKALLMARRAEDLQSKVSEIVEIAFLYRQVGEAQDALDRYLRADRLGDEPKGPLRAAIASCYFELGNVVEGCSYMKDALKFNPDNIYVKETWETYRDMCS